FLRSLSESQRATYFLSLYDGPQSGLERILRSPPSTSMTGNDSAVKKVRHESSSVLPEPSIMSGLASNLEPSGLLLLTSAITALRGKRWTLVQKNHPYLLQLKDAADRLELHFDPLHVASFKYRRAKEMCFVGEWLSAERLLDEALVL